MAGTIRACVALTFGVLCAIPPIARADFVTADAPGIRDAAGRFMGGRELRVLTTYAGKVYAGLGYWQNRPGPEGPQSAAVLVLDGPGAAWRVDHAFVDRMPNGR